MNLDYKEMLKTAMEKIPKKESAIKRFKVPKVTTESQGARTVFKNLSEIANVLRRDEKHIAKFLGKSLATPFHVQNGTLVLQLKVSQELLQKKVEEYIKIFVYCKVCGEPDTKLEKEGRVMFLRCEACGARSSPK